MSSTAILLLSLRLYVANLEEPSILLSSVTTLILSVSSSSISTTVLSSEDDVPLSLLLLVPSSCLLLLCELFIERKSPQFSAIARSSSDSSTPNPSAIRRRCHVKLSPSITFLHLLFT